MGRSREEESVVGLPFAPAAVARKRRFVMDAVRNVLGCVDVVSFARADERVHRRDSGGADTHSGSELQRRRSVRGSMASRKGNAEEAWLCACMRIKEQPHRSKGGRRSATPVGF